MAIPSSPSTDQSGGTGASLARREIVGECELVDESDAVSGRNERCGQPIAKSQRDFQRQRLWGFVKDVGSK